MTRSAAKSSAACNVIARCTRSVKNATAVTAPTATIRDKVRMRNSPARQSRRNVREAKDKPSKNRREIVIYPFA
jgi:hypothetical protein